MDAFFERLVQISLSGSILVLAVLLLRLILKKAPRRTVCLLWMLAVLRLLVPLQIESEWSLQPEPVTIIPPKQTESFDSGTVHTAVPPENWEDPVEYPLRQPQETPKQTEPMDILPWIWLAGAVLLAAHGAVSYLRLKRRVRSAVILEEGVWVCPGQRASMRGHTGPSPTFWTPPTKN
jgi:beta-lactamase regulating signal transducer with metallopeptidase domain